MASRKCVNCRRFNRCKDLKDHIGICVSTGKLVKDTLCGCVDGENGEVVLKNFGVVAPHGDVC